MKNIKNKLKNEIEKKSNFMFLILIMFVLVFSLSGCNDNGNLVNFNPYQGTEGLRVTIMNNAPPYEIYEGETIPIALKIENVGAYDIRLGRVSFAVEERYMSYPQPTRGDSPNFAINGKSLNLQTGESQIKAFYSQSKKLDDLSRERTIQMLVSTCYEYETTYSESICVDTDIFNLYGEKKACERKDLYPSSQGAPIAVRTVRQIMNSDPNNLTFEITIENVGGGEVFDESTVTDQCTKGSYIPESYNKIYVEGWVSLDDELQCDKNVVELNNEGTAKVKCSFMKTQGLEDFTFVTLIKIKLYYSYMSTISKEIYINGLD